MSAMDRHYREDLHIKNSSAGPESRGNSEVRRSDRSSMHRQRSSRAHKIFSQGNAVANFDSRWSDARNSSTLVPDARTSDNLQDPENAP